MSALKDRLPATLATARLVLATPTLAHAPAIARLCNNHNVHKWMARHGANAGKPAIFMRLDFEP